MSYSFAQGWAATKLPLAAALAAMPQHLPNMLSVASSRARRAACIFAAIATSFVASTSDAQDAAVAPTPAEASAQAKKVVELQATATKYDKTEDEVTALKSRISLLEQQVVQSQAIRDELDKLRKEAEQKKKEQKEQESVLRTNTIPEWAGSVKGLSDGLAAAEGIGAVGEIVLIYRPGSSAPWANAIDYIGRGVAGLGGVVALGAGNQEDQTNALRAASGGVAAYFLGTILRKATTRGGDSLKVFVERVSMHKTFASDVLALNQSVGEVIKAVEPLAKAAKTLLDIQPADPRYACKYKAFRVADQQVGAYRSAIESYGVLISQLSQTNRTATNLLQQTWTSGVQTDLQRITNKTESAIKRWREQVILSEGLLNNMSRLAVIDAQPGAQLPACP